MRRTPCGYCAPALPPPTVLGQTAAALRALASLAKGCARRRVSRPTAPKGRLLGRDEGDRRTAVEGFPAGTPNEPPFRHTEMVRHPTRRGRCPQRPVPRHLSRPRRTTVGRAVPRQPRCPDRPCRGAHRAPALPLPTVPWDPHTLPDLLHRIPRTICVSSNHISCRDIRTGIPFVL